jgi:hypothetical protein
VNAKSAINSAAAIPPRNSGVINPDAFGWSSLEHDDDQPPRFFIEPRDKSAMSETKRQEAFVNWMRVHAPAVRIVASANGFLRTDYQRLKAKREGMDAGASDLAIFWNHGSYFAEFKDGQAMPTDGQVRWLNWMHAAGFRVGVYRNRVTLIRALVEAGAPIVGRIGEGLK